MGHVEVVVRFAGDLVDVIEVPAGSTYWVGTTAVRAVAGSEATIGHVIVTVEPIRGEREAIRRPRPEVRPYVYGALSLVAQMAVVVVAFWTASSEPVSAPAIEADHGQRPGAVRIKRFATPAQTVERSQDPAPTEAPVTADLSPEQSTELATPPPQQQVKEFSPSEMSGGGVVDNAPESGDGTSQFDPAQNPAFDTIKVGNYSTVSTGRTAGDGYGPEARNSSLVVITCDRASCLVLGGEKAARIRKAVDEHVAELTDCYKRAAASGGGKVEIDFQVDAAGTVDDLEVGDADPAGTCVAKILRRLQIGAADETASSS